MNDENPEIHQARKARETYLAIVSMRLVRRARHAAQAAASVGQQTASGGASGSAPEVKPKRERVPRYIVDKRTQQKRALTPTEIAAYMKAHPNAV